MKRMIVQILFFGSLICFCIEGSAMIMIIATIIFCCSGLYISRHYEEFTDCNNDYPRIKNRKKKSRHGRAA